MKIWAVWLAILGVAIAGATAQISELMDPTRPKDPREFFETRMRQAHVPGLAVAILHGGEVAWADGFGRVDAGTDRPVTAETLFHVASVSKTITGTAVMQLVERGLVDLDGPVDEYLPFSVRNPRLPDEPITIRQLMAHTSSLRDHDETYMGQYTLDAGGGDSPLALASFVEGYVSPGGTWYDAEANFADEPPGTSHDYSNVGFALLGVLVEAVSGIDFADYCRENVFEPLGMVETGFRIAEVDESLLAHPHEYKDGTFTVLPHYSYATYPDGSLRTSVAEYALFLQAMMNGGLGANGSRILEEATVAEMIRTQFPELNSHQGLAWDTKQIGNLDPERCARGPVPGHTGGDPGVFSIIFYVPDERSGAILFANGLPDLKIAPVLSLIASVRRLVLELDAEPNREEDVE